MRALWISSIIVPVCLTVLATVNGGNSLPSPATTHFAPTTNQFPSGEKTPESLRATLERSFEEQDVSLFLSLFNFQGLDEHASSIHRNILTTLFFDSCWRPGVATMVISTDGRKTSDSERYNVRAEFEVVINFGDDEGGHEWYAGKINGRYYLGLSPGESQVTSMPSGPAKSSDELLRLLDSSINNGHISTFLSLFSQDDLDDATVKARTKEEAVVYFKCRAKRDLIMSVTIESPLNSKLQENSSFYNIPIDGRLIITYVDGSSRYWFTGKKNGNFYFGFRKPELAQRPETPATKNTDVGIGH